MRIWFFMDPCVRIVLSRMTTVVPRRAALLSIDDEMGEEIEWPEHRTINKNQKKDGDWDGWNE